MCPTPGRGAWRCRRMCTCFPIGRVETLDLVRGGETIARVQGTSCREDGEVEARGFHRDAHGLFTIGVAYGTSDSRRPRRRSRALHGPRRPARAANGRRAAGHRPLLRHAARPRPERNRPARLHASSPSTKRGRAKTQFVATDTVRWIEQSLEVTASTRAEQLHDRMVERLEKLQAKHPGIDLFVRWKIRGTGPLVNRLRPGGLADELLVDLRRKFGERSPVAWSVSIDMRLAAQRAGRMVRPGNRASAISCAQVREFELHEDLPFDLRQFLPEDVRDESLAAIAHVETTDERAELLCRAAKLGVDLLTLPLEEGDIPAE